MEKREALCTVGGNADWCSHCEKLVSAPHTPKVKNGTALQLIDSASGNISQETWYTDLKVHMRPCVHCNIIYSSQEVASKLEAKQVHIKTRVNKKIVRY